MASTQEDTTPVKELTEESTRESPISTEEKTPTSEEAEVVVPTSEEAEVVVQEEEEGGDEKSRGGDKISELTEEETWVQSQIIGEEEPVHGATFDREREAKAETEEQDEDTI